MEIDGDQAKVLHLALDDSNTTQLAKPRKAERLCDKLEEKLNGKTWPEQFTLSFFVCFW